MLLSINSGRIEDVEDFLAKTTNYCPKGQINEDFLPQLDTDIL